MCRLLQVLAILCLAFAPAPSPEPVKKAVQRPVEVAFAKIYIGMPANELRQVMAPFEKVHTGHGQWPCWTDGLFMFTVTIWEGGGPLGNLPEGVQELELFKKADGPGARWVLVKRFPTSH